MSYDEWELDDLRAACSERGLKVDGEKPVLVARLETLDSSQAAAVDTAFRKRKRDSASAGRTLRQLCYSGSRDAVVHAIVVDAADVNWANERGSTPLMAACERGDWDVAEEVVSALLQHGALVRVANLSGRTALHVATDFSSPAVVEMLIKAGALVNARTRFEATPLHGCMLREWEFNTVVLPIAKMLLDAGAAVDALTDELDTPLLFACGYGSAALVELLLSRGANASTVNSSKHSTLMYACDNPQHGPQIVPLLMRAGVSIDLVDVDGRSALNWAFSRGGVSMRALAPYVASADQFAHRLPSIGCPDPIGAMSEATAHGFSLKAHTFRDALAHKNPASYCWAILRSGEAQLYDMGERDLFRVMASCADARLWWLVASELQGTRHPVTRDTLLHVAARANSADAVRACCAHWINPLLRNNDDALPVECATDKDVRALLTRYAGWQPHALVTNWFGPFFRARARAWLLVCHQWQRTHVRRVQREIRLRVIEYVAAAEETHVRRRHR